MVGAGNDTVKRKAKPAKNKLPKEPPLNLSGVKFEDAVRALLRFCKENCVNGFLFKFL